MVNKHKNYLQLFLLCFLMVTLLFVALYKPFIFDGKMYAYQDIGSDTIHQYLPNYTVETELLHNGEGDGYTLRFGLGRYVAGLLTKYLNPANWALLIFGAENVHIGILVSTYIRYVMICFFALLYFLRILKNEKAAVVSALVWTFNGFNILWGQHYHFLTAMVGFTACMYGFQLFLEEDKKWYLAVPLLALLLGSNYYFAYMTMWFLIAYGIFYLAVVKREKTVFILKKVGIFALLAVLAAGMSAAYLVPSAMDFLDSSRTNQVAHYAAMSANFTYPATTLLAFVARFFSSNLLGIANGYTGPTNYYEIAILSVSFLFVFSVAFLLLGKYRIRTLGILAVCGLLLCTPMTSRWLVFSEDTQRWTYLLCFLQTITIGIALSEYLGQKHEPKRAFFAVLIGDGVLALLGLILLYYHYRRGGGWMNKESFLTVIAILLIYHAGFALAWKWKHKFAVLLCLMAVEIVLGNYATVNHRAALTVEQWYSYMYNDGTQNVVDWIQERDGSVYRINKTYYSVYKSDSLVQGYNGMGSYSSTNSTHLVNLARTWGDADAGSWVIFNGRDWLANDLLGVKYIISRSEEQQVSHGLKQIYDDGAFRVYENTDWSGFGYLCYGEMAESSLEGLTRDQQAQLLTQYYYRSGNDNAVVKEVTGKEIDLLPYLSEAHDCKVETTQDGIIISETGIDPQLHFSVPNIDGWRLTGLAVEMNAEAPSVVQLFASTQARSFSEEQSFAVGYDAGEISCLLGMPVAEPVAIRLDPTMAEGQTITLRSLKLVYVDPMSLQQQQAWQLAHSLKDLQQMENTFTGTITNPSEETGMLCVPLIYSDRWEATVDGKSAEISNINGGLVGIPIPTDTHAVTLTYDDTVYTVGKIVNWCAITGYAVLYVLYGKKKMMNWEN